MIGPDIPVHLLQKRSSEPEQEESDDEQLGPQIRITKYQETSSIGPQIPAQFLNQSKRDEEDDDDDDDYTPTLPPSKPTSTSYSQQKPKTPSRESARRPQGPVIGPSFPSRSYDDDDDDDDDDDVGPKPLPAGIHYREKDAVQEFMEREERRRKAEEEANKPKALKRDEWMLVPPSSSDLLGKLDPTKLKARQFARSSGSVAKADNSLWTETPQERQQRLADEVSGKKRRAVDAANDDDILPAEDRKRRRQEEEKIRRGVDEYTQKRRGPSLIDQHSSGKPEEEEEFKGIWDHARDMSLGGRLMDDGKRKQMINEAKGLGDRFGSGKGGSFL